MKWRVIAAIAQKDIVDAVKNQYVFIGLLLPIGLSLLFRLVFSGPGGVDTVTVAVYDPGGSRLVAGLRGFSQVKVIEVASEQQLPDVVRKRAMGGLAVPAGFDAAVEAGQKPDLAVYTNSRQGGGGLAAFQRLVERQVWALVEQEFPARITSVDVAAQSGARPQGEFRFDQYLLGMLLVMSLAMAGAFMVPTLMVEEKEKHTLQVLLVSPAGPAEVTAGKAITGLLYSLLLAAVLIVLNQGWVGNWPVTALAILLGAMFVVVVGLLMGSLFRTSMQVNTWSSLVMLALMMPSWLTMIAMPAPLEAVFRLIPTYYMMGPLGLALAGQASWARVWRDLAVLAVSTVVVFAAVVWALRRLDRSGA